MSVREADLGELEEALAAGRRLLDVRGAEEYVGGHVPGAELVPLPDLLGQVDGLPTAGPVYVVCRSGNRSAQAAELLTRLGVDARSVAGGTDAWQRSGRRVETGLKARLNPAHPPHPKEHR